MQKSTGRWVVSGMLGLAVVSAGCATQPHDNAATQQVGPAVVLDVSRANAAAPPASAAKRAAGAGATVSADTPDDDEAKRVPVAKPRAADTPDSPRSAPTP